VPEWADPVPPKPSETERRAFDQLATVDVDDWGGGFAPTPFFEDAIAAIFAAHVERIPRKGPVPAAGVAEGEDLTHVMALRPKGVASWMEQSLGENVKAFDTRVKLIISKYGTYGTGYLTQGQFRKVYVAAVKKCADAAIKQFGNAKKAVAVDVFRDFENHGIMSPVERRWQDLEDEWERVRPNKKEGSDVRDSMAMIDECEILDWGQTETGKAVELAIWGDGTDKKGKRTDKKGKSKKKGPGSHHDVQLAKDGKTPLYLKDGDFVFIDEESCIGCTQCAIIAPGAYKMTDSGRARTFVQGSDESHPEIQPAVDACPVSCMHRVSYDELAEFESARDGGDGRTDHRHMGGQITHTPVHVARRGTDANHKSSWYHYLKNKCLMSSSCPQKGCHDCPMYSRPGENPYAIAKAAKAEKTRLAELESLLVDESIWQRKFAEL